MTHLHLSVLGPLEVHIDGEAVKTFRSAKTRALLVYLALESNRPHTRDALAGLLWPDEPNRTARDNLRQTLAILRKTIGDDTDTTSPRLEITRNTIQFNPHSEHSVDALTFAARLDACVAHRHRHSESCRVCAENRRQAVELYCGDFLDQFYLSDSAPFEEWALLKRERMREMALDALYQLVEFHTAKGQHKQALAFALKQLAIDPWREEAHRQAMRALALDGRTAAALAQFESCQRGLAEEMGAEPAQETVALQEAIKQQGAGTSAEDGVNSLLYRAPPCQLPSPVTLLLGREAELAELDRLLSDPACRLVSIVGLGGAGKTRLAIATAAEHKTDFKDGVYFVSLASVDAPRLIASTILAALGAASRGAKDAGEQLVTLMREREVLLVLDNMEHLLEGTGWLAELLRRAPRVTLLVTSRERLNLQGEWVLDLGGLTLPEGQRVEEVEANSAVQLFIQNAGRARPGHVFTDEDKASIVRTCRLVEGMPLAIELASAWVRTLSCREIAEQIQAGFGLLTTALRDVPERHRSMRAVFEHSWNLLAADERAAMRGLAVFAGEFQREAAAQVAGASLEVLAALVDKSLVRSTTPDWYDLHNLVRQFASEQLDAAGGKEATRERHALYYLGIAEAAMGQLDGPAQADTLKQLERENANMRAALAWSVEGDTARAGTGLRLCGALARTWDMRGYASEGRRWLELALGLADSEPSVLDGIPVAVRVKALTAAGGLSAVQGDHLEARSFHCRALELVQTTDNKIALATCFLNLGNAANHLGEYAEGHAHHTQALAVYRELGNRAGEARTLLNMGVGAHYQGDYAAARALYEESLAIRRELGDPYGTALVLGNLGGLAKADGDLVRTRAYIEESLAVRRSIGDQYGIAHCTMELADLAHVEGDVARARVLYKQSLGLVLKVGDAEMLAGGLDLLAGIEAEAGAAEQAITLLGAADAMRRTRGIPMPSARVAQHEETLARVRSAYGDTAFERAWERGQAMSTEQAVAYAIEA